MLLTVTLFLSGCILAARKGLGTIRGAHGSMTILTNDGSVSQGETFDLIRIQNLVGGSFKRIDERMLKGAIETALAQSGYLNGSNADLVMLIQIKDFTDRPAKKDLGLSVEISRAGTSIATAVINADLSGFGSQDSVAEAIGRACVRFIEEIKQP